MKKFLTLSLIIFITISFVMCGVTDKVATPTITPDGGSHQNSVEVTLATETAGAKIFYTTDSTDPAQTDGTPTGTTMEYTAPFTITTAGDTTVKAIAVDTAGEMLPSDIASATFSLTLSKVATPTITPDGGSHENSVEVTLATTTTDTKILYTKDGTNPSHSSGTPTGTTMEYTAPFTIASAGDTTIKALAIDNTSTLDDSDIAEATFTITLSKVATPTFEPAGGNYSEPVTVEIDTTTIDTTILYTTDGSSPAHTDGTPDGTTMEYTGTFTIVAEGDTTVKAIAIDDNSTLLDSEMAEVTYSITLPTDPTLIVSNSDGLEFSVEKMMQGDPNDTLNLTALNADMDYTVTSDVTWLNFTDADEEELTSVTGNLTDGTPISIMVDIDITDTNYSWTDSKSATITVSTTYAGITDITRDFTIIPYFAVTTLGENGPGPAVGDEMIIDQFTSGGSFMVLGIAADYEWDIDVTNDDWLDFVYTDDPGGTDPPEAATFPMNDNVGMLMFMFSKNTTTPTDATVTITSRLDGNFNSEKVFTIKYQEVDVPISVAGEYDDGDGNITQMLFTQAGIIDLPNPTNFDDSYPESYIYRGCMAENGNGNIYIGGNYNNWNGTDHDGDTPIYWVYDGTDATAHEIDISTAGITEGEVTNIAADDNGVVYAVVMDDSGMMLGWRSVDDDGSGNPEFIELSTEGWPDLATGTMPMTMITLFERADDGTIHVAGAKSPDVTAPTPDYSFIVWSLSSDGTTATTEVDNITFAHNDEVFADPSPLSLSGEQFMPNGASSEIYLFGAYESDPNTLTAGFTDGTPSGGTWTDITGATVDPSSGDDITITYMDGPDNYIVTTTDDTDTSTDEVYFDGAAVTLDDPAASYDSIRYIKLYDDGTDHYVYGKYRYTHPEYSYEQDVIVVWKNGAIEFTYEELPNMGPPKMFNLESGERAYTTALFK